MEVVQQDAIGVAIICTIEEDDVAVDVSAVTSKQLVFRKPDGTVVTKTASFVTSGTDGQVKYTTVSGDLDTVGVWEVQASVTFSGGFSGRSDVQVFEVAGNLA